MIKRSMRNRFWVSLLWSKDQKKKINKQFDNKENMSKEVLEREAIVKSSVEYFKEDALAADVWINKYALRDGDNIYELNPDQMHRQTFSKRICTYWKQIYKSTKRGRNLWIIKRL